MVTDREADGPSKAPQDLLNRYLQHAQHLRSVGYDGRHWGCGPTKEDTSLWYQMSHNVGKRLAKTKKGYVGIVPHSAMVGDAVHILAGGYVPVVLRSERPRYAMRGRPGQRNRPARHVSVRRAMLHPRHHVW
jgi:hypothetical protein